MHAKTGEALRSAGWDTFRCSWCNCPDLEFSGHVDTGITRIDCRDCGARFTRMARSQAIEWATLQFSTAVSMGLLQQARDAKTLLDLYWSAVYAGMPADQLWVMTRTGSGGDDADSIPF